MLWPAFKTQSSKFVHSLLDMGHGTSDIGHQTSDMGHSGVMPGKSQIAVLQLYSTIFIFAVSKLKPKQYKLS